ncbi:MAG: squalene synthase HpnC, partial [Chromatiales bacterium]|nr:squalene synthase HpnC [Chromatiales bacterium]
MANLVESYQHCKAFASRHYENFPVASMLLPTSIRPAVAVLYTFARTADDLADEGDLTEQQRLNGLDELQNQLDAILFGRPSSDPVFNALGDVIERYRIPHRLLNDLLDAFRQDVSKTRYADESELLDYCRRSANPVGQAMLCLVSETASEQFQQSDAICSALQLINFLQDISQDYHEMGRIYLPQDEMLRFGVTEEQIARGETTPELKSLIDHQLERVEKLLKQGESLGNHLSGRFGLEIRMIIAGAWKVTGKLR